MKTITLILLLATSFKAAAAVRFEEVLKVNSGVWGFDFLPDGRIVFTQKKGTLAVFDPKTSVVKEIAGMPKVKATGQGGLLDVRVSPEYSSEEPWIYFTYSAPVDNLATTELMRAKLGAVSLSDQQKLLTAEALFSGSQHYGSRIEFDKEGHLFVSIGERNQREKAQLLDNHHGKLLRLNLDGSVPDDNPFAGRADAKAEIWNYGLRNPQGLTTHPVTGDLWEAEMGPQGGDEINIIKKGANLGWPVITYGKEYSGQPIGVTSRAGMEQPLVYWVPSISPSGITFYTGDKYPDWKHNLFIATLSGQHVRRLTIANNRVTAQEELLSELGHRWRQLRTGPDGHLYGSTDDGRLGRIHK
jgi:glucose/arabinose dehydrogenase